MTSSSGLNVGLEGSVGAGTKNNGNLPIALRAAHMFNGTASNPTGRSARLYFGLDSQTSRNSYDVSTDTKLLLFSMQFNAPNRVQCTTIANGGLDLTLISAATANFKRYQIGGNDTPFGSSRDGSNTICIGLDAPNPDSEGGTFSNQFVNGFGVGSVRLNLAATNSLYIFWSRVHVLETTKDAPDLPNFTGTSDWNDAFVAVNGTSFVNRIGTWLVNIGSAYFVPIPWSIGNGITPTTFNDSGAVVVSPENNAALAENFRIGTQEMRVYYSMPNSSTSTATLSGTYVWGTAAPWNFDESNNSVCTFNNPVFTGMGDFTVGSSISGPAIFNLSSGSNVIVNGANLNGSTINGDMVLNSETNLTNIHITGDLRCNINSDAIITLTDCTIDGNIWNDSPNTLTVNSITSVANTGDAGTGNGETNLVATVTLTVNVTRKDDGSNISGASIIVIRDSDERILVTGTTNNLGVFSEPYAYTSDESVTIRVRKSTLPIPRYFAKRAGNTVTNSGFIQNISLVQDFFVAQE